MGKCYEAVLDTSSILFAVDRRVDIIDLVLHADVPVCKIVILTLVLREIKYLTEKGKGSQAVKAAVALEMINKALKTRENIVAVIDPGPLSGTVDDIVINAARAETRILVTADREMRERARKLGVKAYLLSKASLKLL